MREQTLDQFLDVLSTKAPVPGGGGASALGGAIGAALAGMVCGLTLGKKKYADVQEEIEEILKKAEELREKLSDLIEKDAVAFEPLSKAYGLPKETEEQLKYRNQVLEEALVVATEVPLMICEVACETICLQERLAVIGSKIAVSDVGVGAAFCKAALQGGALNVRINTKLMKDRAVAKKYDEKLDLLLEEYIPRADAVYESVARELYANV